MTARRAPSAEILRDAVGLPRPRVAWIPTDAHGELAPGQARALPVPWVNGAEVLDGDWFGFRSDFDSQSVHDDRTCVVCGIGVVGPIVYLRYDPGFGSKRRHVPATNGPGAHAACAVVSARHCPHLVDQHTANPDTIIAYAWEGDGQGYDLDANCPHKDITFLYGNIIVLREDVVPMTLAQLTAYARTQPRPTPSGCPAQAPAAAATCPAGKAS